MSSKRKTSHYCPRPAADGPEKGTPQTERRTLPPLVQVGDVILATDILTECFCCNLEACRGICCVEGESGAPLTLDEVACLENVLDAVSDELSPEAHRVIARQGVAYTDADGDLVTSIVNGRDCVFTCYDAQGCCLCATERAWREGRTTWCKPISCSLYPIRERKLGSGLTGLSYHGGTSAPRPYAKKWNCACRYTVSCANRLCGASVKHGTPNWKPWWPSSGPRAICRKRKTDACAARDALPERGQNTAGTDGPNGAKGISYIP